MRLFLKLISCCSSSDLFFPSSLHSGLDTQHDGLKGILLLTCIQLDSQITCCRDDIKKQTLKAQMILSVLNMLCVEGRSHVTVLEFLQLTLQVDAEDSEVWAMKLMSFQGGGFVETNFSTNPSLSLFFFCSFWLLVFGMFYCQYCDLWGLSPPPQKRNSLLQALSEKVWELQILSEP